MSARIDGELDESALHKFTQHINECRECRNEYELEQLTKDIIQQVIPPTKAPNSVLAAVRKSIAEEAQAEFPVRPPQKVFAKRPNRTFMLALGLAGIAVVLFLITPMKSHRSHAQPVDENIVHQTYNNFDKVLNASFTPDARNNDASMFTTSLSKCRCRLHMPMLKECKFVKGTHSTFNNDHVAEFVFQRNSDPVYVYEAKLQDVMTAGSPRMDSNVLQSLLTTGWYAESREKDCSMILHLVDSTVYCTVADMNKEQLFALLR
jgi:hypothetical protein